MTIGRVYLLSNYTADVVLPCTGDEGTPSVWPTCLVNNSDTAAHENSDFDPKEAFTEVDLNTHKTTQAKYVHEDP